MPRCYVAVYVTSHKKLVPENICFWIVLVDEAERKRFLFVSKFVNYSNIIKKEYFHLDSSFYRQNSLL
jgi:hypothetical protein